MRLATATRRTIATLAATALVSTGGIVSGVLTGVANAEVLQSVTPSSGSNAAVVTVELKTSGTNWYPTDYDQNEVVLRRITPATGQGDIIGTDYATPEGCDSLLPAPLPDDPCGTKLTFKADLTNAAPGSYQVLATATAQLPTSDSYEFTFSPFVIAGQGAPTMSATALDPTLAEGATSPPDGQLTITGERLAKGTKVEFLVPGGSPGTFALDPKITFTPTSYVSSTTLKGTYATAAGFVPGEHKLRVTNTADQSTVSSVSFFQPVVESTTPTAIEIGQGASEVPVTLTAPAEQVFAPGSTVFINSTGSATASPDVSADSVVVSANGKTLSFSLAAGGSAVVGKRNLTVRGPDGGYTRLTDAITVNAKPVVTSISPNTRGQGSTTVPDGASPSVVTVTGTGLKSSTVFDFGPGVTATTAGSTGPTNATIELVVDPAATTGARNVTATNPDGGTSATANALTITAKPVIATIDPSSDVQGSAGNLTLTGTGFVSGATLKASGTGVTFGATSGNSNTLTSTYTIAGDATLGARNVTITNPDGGTSTCIDCFGVNSLIVTGGPVFNTQSWDIKVKPAAGQPALTAQTVVTFTLPSATDQGALPGAFVSLDPDGTLTVKAPFTKAAAGRYNVVATTGSSELICVGCVRVLAEKAPAGIAIDPTTGGQGALSKTVVVTGTEGIYRGQTVQFGGTGITTKSTTYKTGPERLEAVIDIAPGATVGPRTVTVVNVGDPATKGTGPGTFTVVVGPATTEVSPDSIGQGAANVPGTLTGTGYQDGATVTVSGTGVTATVLEEPAPTATSLAVAFSVASGAPVGVRDITVTNPDGGSSTLDEAIEVTAAPVLTSLTPNKLPKGAGPVPVTINGSNLNKTDGESPQQPSVSAAGLTFTELAVNSDGTAITGMVAVAANAVDGKRPVTVTNPDGGRFTLVDGFEVATPPTAPTSVTATGGDTTLKASWSGAAPGGSAITEYTAQLYDVNLVEVANQTKVVAAPTSTATFTGLTNGTQYKVRVKAKNAAGYSEFSTAVGTATPRFATKLTSTSAPRSSISGNAVTFSGKVTRVSNGTGVAGVKVVLTLRPSLGSTATVQVTTTSTGTWSFTSRPVYNTSVGTRFPGSLTTAPSTAPTYLLGVATKVTITSPRSGTSSSAATTLVITGKTSPNKSGRTIGLFRLVGSSYQGIGQVRVKSDGTYSFSVRLGRGTYTLRTGLPSGGGNTIGFSTPITIKRT